MNDQGNHDMSKKALELLKGLEQDEGGLFLPPAYPFLSELATAGFVRVQRAKHWQGSVVMITAAGRVFVEGGAATDAGAAEAEA